MLGMTGDRWVFFGRRISSGRQRGGDARDDRGDGLQVRLTTCS